MFNFLSAVSLRFCFMNVIQVSLSVPNNGTIQLFSENTGCPKHTQNNLLFTHTQNSLLSTPTQNSLLSTHTKNSLLYKILRSVCFPRRPRTVCFTKYLDQFAFHADIEQSAFHSYLEQSALQNTQISLLSTCNCCNFIDSTYPTWVYTSRMSWYKIDIPFTIHCHRQQLLSSLPFTAKKCSEGIFLRHQLACDRKALFWSYVKAFHC